MLIGTVLFPVELNDKALEEAAELALSNLLRLWRRRHLGVVCRLFRIEQFSLNA